MKYRIRRTSLAYAPWQLLSRIYGQWYGVPDRWTGYKTFKSVVRAMGMRRYWK